MTKTSPPQCGRTVIAIGSFMAALAVIFGAFGTHGLRGKIGFDLLQIYETGSQYLMYHAIGTVLYGLWAERRNLKLWPAYCFILGAVIFTGSLFCITFTGIREFGMITPLGGVLFIVAWLGFGFQALSGKDSH